MSASDWQGAPEIALFHSPLQGWGGMTLLFSQQVLTALGSSPRLLFFVSEG